MRPILLVLLLGALCRPSSDPPPPTGPPRPPGDDLLGEVVVYQVVSHRAWPMRCVPPRGHHGYTWWIEVYLPEHRLAWPLGSAGIRAVERDTTQPVIAGELLHPAIEGTAAAMRQRRLMLSKRPELTLTDDARRRLVELLQHHLAEAEMTR